MRRIAACFLWLVFQAAVLVPAVGHAQAESFADFLEDLWPDAQAQGVSRATFDAAFDGVVPDAGVVPAATSQPEFVRPIWDYLDSIVSQARIVPGQRMLEEHYALLNRIEAEFGVSRYVVVAIWGIETSYGAVLANTNLIRDTVRSLATLAYQGGSRAAYGRTQLLAALRILESGVVAPRQMTGSWAGAMGHTQFIPTSYLAYAVDFDGDGKADIWHSIPDALASAANYLAEHGWRTGQTWGYEVVLAPDFDYSLADRVTERTLAEWQALGAQRRFSTGFPRPDDPATLWVPAGAHGPAFLLIANFGVVKRYNNADSYALAVGHLADRLLGLDTFAQPWPRDQRPLTNSELRELQTLLNAAGFDAGAVDGVFGRQTAGAIRGYQAARGLVADGYANTELLERLRREAGNAAP